METSNDAGEQNMIQTLLVTLQDSGKSVKQRSKS